MRNCNCCKNNENIQINTYILPMIGYGSAFDCMDERDRTRFNLCPECAKKINAWLKERLPKGTTLEEFWKCRIIEKHGIQGATYYEFEHEQLIMDMFVEFMPEVIFDERTEWEVIKYKAARFFA